MRTILWPLLRIRQKSAQNRKSGGIEDDEELACSYLGVVGSYVLLCMGTVWEII